MPLRHLLPTLLAFLTLSAQAQMRENYFKFSELMQAPTMQKLIDPSITLYWAGQPTPNMAEVARPEAVSRSGISLSPFGGSPRHCVEAFEEGVKTLYRKARERGYDAVINIQAARDRKPTEDTQGFHCKPGYKTTEVALWSSFAMTAAGKQKMLDEERKSANVAPRPPVAGAIFLPLDAIVASPEGQAALSGYGVKAFIGLNAPEYKERQGPEIYGENYSLEKITPEEACRLAVIKTLDDMAQTAKERRYDSIIKIRSYLNYQYTPVPTEVECQVGKSKAGVKLQASLANTKENE